MVEIHFKVSVASQGALVVFAVIGVIVSSLNYGQNYPSFRTEMKTFEDVNLNYTEKNDVYQKIQGLRRSNFLYSDYKYDPRTWGVAPFLSTFLVGSVLTVGGIISSNIYETTTVLNAGIAMWLLHLSYMFSFINQDYIPDVAKSYISACLPAVISLHVLMLLLLSAAIIISGWRLRSSEISWPRCNCQQLFTMNTMITIARLVYSGITLPITSEDAGRGLTPRFEETHESCMQQSCLSMRVEASRYFISVAVLGFSLVFAIEAFLSSVWGKKHRALAIVAAVLSGVGNLFVGTVFSPVGLYSYEAHYAKFYRICLAMVIPHLFHGWLMWCSWDFIHSPPSILTLVCGRRNNINEETRSEPFARQDNEVINDGNIDLPPEQQQEQEQESLSDAPVVAESDNLDDGQRISLDNVIRVRCLVVNILIMILGIASFPLLAIAIMEYGIFVWDEALLAATMSSTVARASVTVVTVVATGSPPVKSLLQVIVDTGFESLLILIAVVGALTRTRHELVIAVSVLSILVLLLKVLELMKTGPVQSALRLLATTEGDPSHKRSTATCLAEPTQSPDPSATTNDV